MRLGLLSDIHNNASALKVVLLAARKEAVDELLIAGDLVGYYFSPKDVMALLSTWKTHRVRGNHEDMLIESRSKPSSLPVFEKRYGTGLRLALENLSNTDLDALAALPHPLTLDYPGCRILLCHGSPWDIDLYVYPDASADILKRCGQVDAQVVVMGHTHYPFSRTSGKTLLVNPGSVGQPRDRHPGASWAILNTETKEVVFRRETYDIESLAQESRHRHPELPYLADVLLRTA